jgi:fructose transport system substrate-binding protein
MSKSLTRPRIAHRSNLKVASVGLCVVALALTACSSESAATPSSSSSASAAAGPIGVSLIVKTTSNPFFVAMQEGATKAAQEHNLDLTFAAGKEDGDEDTQIQAIENAVAKGDKGILITPNGPTVVDAIAKARAAGVYVIALDTAPEPADAVDITFATDNRDAGKRIGQWTAGALGGEKATIALLDLFSDKVVSVDYNRDQGFLEGLGIDVADGKINGDEASTGKYSGGDYEIVGNEATNGAEDGGRTAMENLLSKNPDINVVYTINEPAAYGAYQALKAVGKEKDVLLVSVDGGCAGVGYVEEGLLDATSQQYPVKMAELGVEAIAELAANGTKPTTSPGLDFFNTGVALVTEAPADGVESIDSTEAGEICWGK